MGIAPRWPKRHVVRSVMRLDRKGEVTARREHAGDRREQPFQPADIDQDVGGDDEVDGRVARFQKLEVGTIQAVVETLRARLSQHGGRDVVAFEKA
jgi:hypothetical protein